MFSNSDRGTWMSKGFCLGSSHRISVNKFSFDIAVHPAVVAPGARQICRKTALPRPLMTGDSFCLTTMPSSYNPSSRFIASADFHEADEPGWTRTQRLYSDEFGSST